jgi:hypothetical protein
MDYNDGWEKFGDRGGWRKDRKHDELLRISADLGKNHPNLKSLR